MNPINIEQKIISSAAQTLPNNTTSTIRQISGRAKSFIDRMKNCTAEEFLEFLENNAQKINTRDSQNTLYQYENLLFHRTNGPNAYNLEQNLKIAENCTSAPTFIKYFELGNNDFVTIMEIPGGRTHNFSEVAGQIGENAKQNFKKDLVRLYRRGFVNQEMFANRNALLVSWNKEQIFMPDWSYLTPIPLNQRGKYVQAIKDFQL